VDPAKLKNSVLGDVLIVPCRFDRTLRSTDTPDRKLRMRSFQIIFNPTSAAELAKMPKELQLQILGEFRGLPHQVMSTELEEFGKLERAGRILHRFRIGDYRVYFEKHELGVVVHRILSRHTLKDFLFRSGLKMDEDAALQQNPKFWEMIEAAKSVQA
jgi:mRNA-degrading endonuclease RelE of RelBE toxin-antitoxin system